MAEIETHQHLSLLGARHWSGHPKMKALADVVWEPKH